jgi:hypothetical protein
MKQRPASGDPSQATRDSSSRTVPSMTLNERSRLFAYAIQRTVWRLSYRSPSFATPSQGPIVVVFGMHRSGTSSAVGILEDLGFTVPGRTPPDGHGDNTRGTREPVELTWLLIRILRMNACSWYSPPTTRLRYTKRHLADRNDILRLCAGKRCVLKDPRMLLMLDFWDGVLIRPMGVVRNPVDVAESLLRRGEPVTRRQCIELWKIYNHALLGLAQKRNCPIAFFDHPDFADQIIWSTHRLGYSDSGATRFFQDRVVRSRTENWRDLVGDREAVALYDELARFAVAPPATLPAQKVGPDRGFPS